MWIDVKPVLHIIYTEDGFKNSIFIRYKSAELLWRDFISCWEYLYIGFREIIRLDREPSFTSMKIRENVGNIGFELPFSETEAQHSIWQREQYHHPCRRILNVINEKQNNLNLVPPSKPWKTIWNLMFCTLNHKQEPEGKIQRTYPRTVWSRNHRTPDKNNNCTKKQMYRTENVSNTTR